MTTAYTPLLGLALPVQGELVGTWGDVVDNAITSYVDAAVAGTQTITGDSNVTLSVTNGSSSATNLAQVGAGTTGSAQYAVINCTGSRTAARTITVPASSRQYIVINATTGGYAVNVVGAGPTTGISVANGEKCILAWNGSDYIKIVSSVVNVIGPASSTDNAIARFDGTTGTLIQNSPVTLSDTGDLTFANTDSKVIGDNITFQSNTTNAGTAIKVIPNGTGNFSQVTFQNGITNYSSFTFTVQSSGAGVLSGGYGGSGSYGPFQISLNGGTGGMYWDTQGNAGLGTTSPTVVANYKGLSINATTGGFVDLLANGTVVGEVLANANGVQINSVAAQPLVLKTNNTDRVSVDSTGNTYIQTGVLWQYSPAPTSKSGNTSLTAAELATGILNVTGGSNPTMTVPTGTAIDAQFSGLPATNIGFDLFVIATNASGTTMATNTGVTAVGSLSVAASTSAQFRFRRTAANTYIMYRLG